MDAITGGQNMRADLGSHCADCGIGTLTANEWYMVKDEIWMLAWIGRRKPWHDLPGQQILCIGCLEQRIGRTLTSCDFTDVPVNRLDLEHSERLQNRLTSAKSAQPACLRFK
jgi:hypothetical protein